MSSIVISYTNCTIFLNNKIISFKGIEVEVEKIAQ